MEKEKKFWKGYSDFTELVLSDDYNNAKREFGSHVTDLVDGFDVILKGDVKEIKQTSFNNGLGLTILYYINPKDVLSIYQYVHAYTTTDPILDFKNGLKSNVNIVANGIMRKSNMFSIPFIEITSITQINETLKYPLIMCKHCGYDYGIDWKMIVDPKLMESRFCQICGDQSLGYVYSREEFEKIPKRHYDD